MRSTFTCKKTNTKEIVKFYNKYKYPRNLLNFTKNINIQETVKFYKKINIQEIVKIYNKYKYPRNC